MGFVDGSKSCPPKTIADEARKVIPNPEYHTWNKKDQYLLSIITTALSEKVLATVYGLDTSQQAWIALAINCLDLAGQHARPFFFNFNFFFQVKTNPKLK
jgi:hypothetical protein